MSILSTLVGAGKAINYEVYRSRYLFLGVGIVFVAALLVGAYQFPSSYDSSFQFRVASHSYAQLNPLQKQADLESHVLTLKQLVRDRIATGELPPIKEENYSIDVALPHHIQITAKHDDKSTAAQHASDLYSLVFFNDEVSQEEESIEGSLSAIIAEERLMRKAIAKLDRSVSQANEADLNGQIEKLESKLAKIQDSIDDAEVELKVIDTKSEILLEQLAQESDLQSEILRTRQMYEKKRFYQQKVADYERRINDSNEQLGYVRGSKSEQERQRERLIGSIASDESALIEYQNKLSDTEKSIRSLNLNAALIESARSKNGNTALYEQLRQQASLSEIDKQVLLKRKASLELMQVEQRGELEKLKVKKVDLKKLQNSRKAQSDQLALFMNKKAELLDLRESILKKKNQYVLDGELHTKSSYVRINMKDAVAFAPLISFSLLSIFTFIFVLVDSRFRSANHLQRILPYGVKVLEEVPHFETQRVSNGYKNTLIFCLCWVAIALSGASIWQVLKQTG